MRPLRAFAAALSFLRRRVRDVGHGPAARGAALTRRAAGSARPRRGQVARQDARELARAHRAVRREGGRDVPGREGPLSGGPAAGRDVLRDDDPPDPEGRFEQVFVLVDHIEDGVVTGRIFSDVGTVRGYKARDVYRFPEADVVDWLISKPDGSEEGNLVGKFIDGLPSQSGAL